MRQRRWWLAGLVLAVGVVIMAATMGSTAPDGLERVAADVGFADRASDVATGLLPGYSVPGIAGGDISTIIAGLLGIAVLFGAMLLLGRVLSRRGPTAR